jgi:hypothetical protein
MSFKGATMSEATNLARAVAAAGGVQNMQDGFELRPRKSKVNGADDVGCSARACRCETMSSGPPRPSLLGRI